MSEFFGMKIPGDTVVTLSDVNGGATIYRGDLTYLTKAMVSGHVKDAAEYLTLDEIADQVGRDGLITVITDTAFEGLIYQYGNYGDYWVLKGKHMGYA